MMNSYNPGMQKLNIKKHNHIKSQKLKGILYLVSSTGKSVSYGIFHSLFVIFCLTFLLSFFINIRAEIYYIDAENGKDSNTGTQEEKAWESISKVNSFKFKPGDQILFKRGEKWTDMLVPASSGTSAAPIIYGAYGKGDKPVITIRQTLPNSNKKEAWQKAGPNTYTLGIKLGETAIQRIWLDNIEYDRSDDPQELDEKYRWFYSNKEDIFYLYSSSNPAETYKSIEFPGGLDNKYHTVKLIDKKYLEFRGIDFQGGYTGTIGLAGCRHITFEECNIGKCAHGRAIIGNLISLNPQNPSTDYIVIRNNNIDSGWKIFAKTNRSGMDAISIQNGANYWEVYNNKFINWDHSCVQIYGIKAPVSHNKVYMNLFTAPDIAFSRAFETVGTDSDMCRYNEIFRNHITNETTRSQIGGTYNKVYYNIFEHLTNSTVPYLNHKSAEAIVFAAVDGPSMYNIICNNTIYATDRDGIWDYGKYNTAVNNLIMDAGRKNKNSSLRISNKVTGATYRNNLIYVPESSEDKPLINYKEKKTTVHMLNALDKNDGQQISGNIQYTGKLSDLVIDAENGNFTPAPKSPVIDAGIDVGLKEDYYGHPIINKPDIGAIEFNPVNPENNIRPASK